MIFINDNPSNIGVEDSDTLILDKISQALNTIPENVIILSKSPNKIEASSIEKQIEILSKKRSTSSYEKMKDTILKINNEIPEKNILMEYIIFYRKKYMDVPDGENILKLTLSSQNIDVDKLNYSIETYQSKKENDIQTISDDIKKASEKIKEIESINTIPHSDFEVELVTYYIDTLYTKYENIPSIIYALDLFADSKITSSVIYMELFINDKKYYKFHDKYVGLKIRETTEDYIMYFLVDDGSGSYTHVYFDFDDVKPVFKVIFNAIQQKRHENVIKNVFKSLPDVKRKDQKELSVRGNVVFEDINVNYLVFSDMVLNNPLFNKRLYIDENTATVSQKSRLNIHYKLPDDNKILFMVTNEEAPNKFLHVRISKAPNRTMVKEFSNMMGKLFTEYIKEEKNVIDFYDSYGIDLTEKEERLMKKKKEPIKKNISKVKILASQVPELFGKDQAGQYARKCQKTKQPTIIDPSEIQKYKDDNYEIMEFPKGDDPNKRYYICDNDPYFFPGLQINTLGNKDKYPYIPCCFSDSQISAPRSKYNEYLSGLDLYERDKKDISHIITLLKVIETPYRLAKLPKDISTWLNAYLDSNTEYFRMGTVSGPLNFLHAVLAAIDREYKTFTTNDDRNEYVKNFLISLEENINLEACKQSNYELSMDELRELWLDPNRYHDALRFVRLLEISLKIKILIISPEQILVPRFIKFYAHAPLNKFENVILLFNHYGSAGVDALNFAHNEVIVNSSSKAIFEGIKAQKLYDAYEKAVTFTQIQNSCVYSKDGMVNYEISQALIFSNPNILTPKLQYIDGYGKVRAVIFDYDGIETILQITPSMPFNLKSINLENLTDYTYMNNNQAKIFIRKLGGTIVGISNKINGYWFYVNNETAMYFIPISDKPQDYQVIFDITLWDGILHKNKLMQMRKSRKLANILLSFFYYLLRINKLSLPLSIDDATKFLNSNTVIIENHEYNIPNKRILPVITSDKDKILRDINNYSSYIQNGRLIITSGEMKNRFLKILQSDIYISQGDKIFQIIIGYVKYLLQLNKKTRPMEPGDVENFISRNIIVINEHKYYEIKPNYPDILQDQQVINTQLPVNYFDNGKLILNSNEMKKIIIKFLSTNVELGDIEVIKGFYEYNYDFPQQPNVNIFIGEEQFKNYIKVVSVEKDVLNVYTQTKTNPVTSFPYVMKFPEFYGIVQNTYSGTLESALSVSYNWYYKNMNTGFDTDEINGIFDDYDGDIIEYNIVDGEWSNKTLKVAKKSYTKPLFVLGVKNYYSSILKV